MIVKTGYTGNNPYVAYQRKAVVTFTATLSNGKKIDKAGHGYAGTSCSESEGNMA